ncbi:MAG: hypothetical protein A2126_00515 [Candidatus Woykebacteria bacterium GWB1_45_5]|uniref:DAGKc domain-containing protein n=1 Tax=Candidatus Woykebacteria bacterium GWB1_45_5 TaxID=1802592 RepID=A0A1G1W859_9BACT|nr:MAG: hypothetical protein A2126_00515 [Candidatus Woykebacteria bacterium GWB1_45_5]
MKTINVIATTISGSIKDWQKLASIEREFKKFYEGKINICIVDSHKEARERTNELVKKGERIIVSAGGAGTFNSVLEGSRLTEGFPEDLRLAFLRKGSADLIGRVLKIPDELTAAAEIISTSIKEDKTIESDVIEVNTDEKKYHLIGFGGIGVFGVVPYFTESRFIKYYKGLLGYFFGDKGPFLVGVNLATIKYYKDKIFKRSRFIIRTKETELPAREYSSVIIMNGDLGKIFPLATGMPLSTGEFKVIILKDLGLVNSYRQMIHLGKGDFEEFKEKLGVQTLKTKVLTIIPEEPHEYMVNVDGLLVRTKEEINFRVSDQIKLITG